MATTAPHRRGPRRATTEDEILDAALALMDQGGAAAVTVRGIAARVGVAPNAVYTYFPDKAAVVKALVERLLSEVNHDVFADRTQPWRLRVEALALELRQRLTAHPGVVQLMISGPVTGPQALALHEALLELLDDAGLSPADAPRASYLSVHLHRRVDRLGGGRCPGARPAALGSGMDRRPAAHPRRDTRWPLPQGRRRRGHQSRLHLQGAVPMGIAPPPRRHRHPHPTLQRAAGT